MNIICKVLFKLLLLKLAKCTVVGINYMDNLKKNALKTPVGEDPCNPLYWYPRNIPDYCNYKVPEKPYNKEFTPAPVPPQPALKPAPPILMPIMPPPLLPIPPPIPVSPPLTIISNPAPAPLVPIPRIPYAMSPLNPGFPNFSVLTSQNSLPYYPDPRSGPPQAGMVPGINGIVTKDGGINIMPFSDAYADMLEKHKNKVIRRKLYKILDRYENYPNRNNYKLLRKYQRYFTDDE